MSDPILEKAVADLDAERARGAEHRRKADAADERAARLETFISMYREYSGAPNAPSSQRNSMGTMSQTAAAAARIIERLGRPVPTAEMLSELAGLGVEVGGKDPIATLSARLSRSDGLVNIRQRGWWVDGKQIEREAPLIKENTPPEGGVEAGEVPASPSQPEPEDQGTRHGVFS